MTPQEHREAVKAFAPTNLTGNDAYKINAVHGILANKGGTSVAYKKADEALSLAIRMPDFQSAARYRAAFFAEGLAFIAT